MQDIANITSIEGIACIAGRTGNVGIVGNSGRGGIVGISAQVLRLGLQLPEHKRIQHHRGHTGWHRLHQHEAVQDRGAHGRRGVRTSYRSKRKYRPQQCWIQSELLHED